MFVAPYFSEESGGIAFTRQQGSDFAKTIADDFNPLHDADAKRFCVPGDLLFTILLYKYGLSQHMEFTFSGMVPEGVELLLPEAADEMRLLDAQGKEYLSMRRSGAHSILESSIESLCRCYVAFSGHTFPDLLVPLLAEQGVMINPGRPMVMYESMGIDLERLDLTDVELELDRNELEMTGKRGAVRLVFNFLENGEVVGRGRKNMLLSGLREYDQAAMDEMVARYYAAKDAYLSS